MASVTSHTIDTLATASVQQRYSTPTDKTDIVRLLNELKASQRKLDREQVDGERARNAARELRQQAEKAGMKTDTQTIANSLKAYEELFRSNIQLQEQLGAENKRYRVTEETLKNTIERIRVLELDGQRDIMAETRKSAASDSQRATGMIDSAASSSGAAGSGLEALQQAKAEKQRWEALLQELNNLLVEEQQKGRQLADQLAKLRVSNPRKSTAAKR